MADAEKTGGQLGIVLFNRENCAMIQKNISDEFAALPSEAQRQVIDFIDFLKTRYSGMGDEGESDFSDEPFIGMWRDREDMRDGNAWVRNLRNTEWELKDG